MHRVAPARPLKPSAPPTASRSPSSYVASGWAESLVSRTLSANSPATPSSSRRHMQPRPACIRRKRDRGPRTLPKCTFYPARARLLPLRVASLDHIHNTFRVPNAASSPSARTHTLSHACCFQASSSTCLSSAISPRVFRARRCLGKPSLLLFDAHTRLCGVSVGELGIALDLCARVGSAHAGGAVQRAIWACRSRYEWTASINVLQVYHIEYRLPLGTLVQCLKA